MSARIGGVYLLVLAGFPGVVWAEDAEVLLPGEVIAKPELAQKWKRECEQKRSAHACYNWGVHQAQTLGNESAAVPSYKVACSNGLRLACFNTAGILIKSPATRDEGIGFFKRTCEMPHHDSDDDSHVEKDLVNKGCELWALTEKYKNLSYEDLFKKLSKVNPPTGRGASPAPRDAAGHPSVWFVNQSVATTRTYFYSEPTSCAPVDDCPARTKKYLLWGDLVTVESAEVTNGFRQVTYKSRSRRTTVGWLKAEDLTLVPLDLSGEDDAMKDTINQERQIAKSLPTTPTWKGRWQTDHALIEIKPLAPERYQCRGDVDGAISDGSKDHDMDEVFQPGGAFAVVGKDDDDCAVYLLAFNNAVIGVQQRMCFGTGADHSYPTFAGLYVSAR